MINYNITMRDKIINNLRIVLDGLSGVGKTTLVKQLFQKYKNDKIISFYEDIDFRDEYKSSKKHIRAFRDNYNIIQDSIPLTILVKKFLASYGYISKKKFEKCLNFYNNKMHHSLSYLHILLVNDDRSIIFQNRKKRGREFEYKNNFIHQDQLDDYIEENLEDEYKKTGIVYLKINVNKKDEIEELQFLIDSIMKKDIL